MALIKCPECGKDVSTAAANCPHCGFPLNKEVVNVEEKVTVKDNPAPINSVWVNSYKNKCNTVKITWTLIFVLVLIILIIVGSASFSGRGSGAAFFILLAFGFLSLAAMLVVLIGWKTRTRIYDGYTILVYSGFRSYLIIENNLQDTGTRFLDGYLPNGKKVHAAIAVWDGAIRIDVDTEIRSRR